MSWVEGMLKVILFVAALWLTMKTKAVRGKR